jgi:transcriptional regulator GlxA family with amidase domain
MLFANNSTEAHLVERMSSYDETLLDLARNLVLGRLAAEYTLVDNVFTTPLDVGMSPHRYVVHLRLQRAIELVRDGRFGFAEIAARTGFADQSHLSRWIRRVHGVSLKEIACPLMRDQNSKNLHDLSLAPP